MSVSICPSNPDKSSPPSILGTAPSATFLFKINVSEPSPMEIEPLTWAPPSISSTASPASSEYNAVCPRSEEHTSELQSRGHLVCRLLLEKKKHNDKENEAVMFGKQDAILEAYRLER